MRSCFFTMLITALLIHPVSYAAEPKTGPVVKGYGPVFPVPETALKLKSGKAYKVSMDVAATSKDDKVRNRNLESAARFLNMNAENDIQFALIVHGPAARDLLSNAAYQSRFNTANPNAGLLSALGDAGVQVMICGQTAAYRGFAPEDFHSSVTIAESAMTAHVRLQSEGYTLIPF